MVRPGVVGATTGAGVGLPLLLFVIFFSSQTQAAVTLFNVAPITSTLSPLITRRYLTATTTKTDVLWKTRDVLLKPHESLSSSSSSSPLSSDNNKESNDWIGWKGGEGQIIPWNWNAKVARRKTDHNLSNFGNRFKSGTTTLRIRGLEQVTELNRESEVIEEGEKVVEEEEKGRTGKSERKVQVSGEITTSVDVFVGDSSGVEWTTASTVAVPMSSLSYPREAQGAGRVRIYLGPKQKRPEEKAGDTKVTLEDKEAESSSIASTTTTTTTQTATTELSPPTRDTSMEACKFYFFSFFSTSFCHILTSMFTPIDPLHMQDISSAIFILFDSFLSSLYKQLVLSKCQEYIKISL